jgi:hypothetical protein
MAAWFSDKAACSLDASFSGAITVSSMNVAIDDGQFAN